MIVIVEVGVATRYPVAEHRTVKVMVSVEVDEQMNIGVAERDAVLFAIAMASGHRDVVMPVRSQIIEIMEI